VEVGAGVEDDGWFSLRIKSLPQEAIGLSVAKVRAEIAFGTIVSGGKGIRCGRSSEVRFRRARHSGTTR
jgi:hypothetical protein